MTRPNFKYASVPASASLKPWGYLIKQPLHQLPTAKIDIGKASGMNRTFFAQRDNTIRVAAQFFRLRIGCPNLFADQKRLHEVSH
jgi:hypothetical protein